MGGVTIKKRLFLSIITLIILFFLFLTNKHQDVEISVTPTSFSPIMSSIQGVNMFVTNYKIRSDEEYYWFTSKGYFLESKRQSATGPSISWTINLRDADIDIDKIFITLKIKNIKTNKFKSLSTVTIKKQGILFYVDN